MYRSLLCEEEIRSVKWKVTIYFIGTYLMISLYTIRSTCIHQCGCSYDICLKEIDRFLPYIDNWATCDMLAVKVVKKHLDTFIDEIYRWMESDHTYTIRFGVNMLMRYYLEDAFRMEYPEKVVQIRSEEYYVNMMRAWYFATALAKQYEKILPFIEEQKLDVWTHNKTIQKAIESYRISPEQKEYLRGLKIKK